MRYAIVFEYPENNWEIGFEVNEIDIELFHGLRYFEKGNKAGIEKGNLKDKVTVSIYKITDTGAEKVDLYKNHFDNGVFSL